jgi:hypothetical protein
MHLDKGEFYPDPLMKPSSKISLKLPLIRNPPSHQRRLNLSVELD